MQTSELKEIKSIDPMIQSRGRLLDINIFEAYFQWKWSRKQRSELESGLAEMDSLLIS